MKVKVKYGIRSSFEPEPKIEDVTGEFKGIDVGVLVLSTESGLRCIRVGYIESMVEIKEQEDSNNKRRFL